MKFNDEDIHETSTMLTYRLDALAQANEHAAVMGIANEAFRAYEYWKCSEEEDKLVYFACGC